MKRKTHLWELAYVGFRDGEHFGELSSGSYEPFVNLIRAARLMPLRSSSLKPSKLRRCRPGRRHELEGGGKEGRRRTPRC